MPAEGEDAAEYIARKYGAPPEQSRKTRARPARARRRGRLRVRRPAARSGTPSTRIACSTGPACRRARRVELKHALLTAYHAHAENPGARDVLLRAAGEVGLDAERARAILDSDEYGAEVRERERHWQQLGIHSVPAVIIDDRHLISGGQPPEVFERALRELAAVA